MIRWRVVLAYMVLRLPERMYAISEPRTLQLWQMSTVAYCQSENGFDFRAS